MRGPEDLEYADVLMRDDLPQAAVALDLMLGTQGWRRFVEQKLPAQQGKGLAVLKEDTSRLLAVNGQAGVKETLPDTRVAQAVNPLVVKYEKLRKDLVAKDVIRDEKTAAARINSKCSIWVSATSNPLCARPKSNWRRFWIRFVI